MFFPGRLSKSSQTPQVFNAYISFWVQKQTQKNIKSEARIIFFTPVINLGKLECLPLLGAFNLVWYLQSRLAITT